MNEQILTIIRKAIWRLPNWATSTLAIIFGMMVALNIITWDALLVFFDQPFNDWFGEIWNYLVGGLIAAGGILYNPRAETPILLTEKVEGE